MDSETLDAPTTVPDGYRLVRTTADFDQATVLPGLLDTHRLADGVWGRLLVRTGALTLRFDDTEVLRVCAAGHAMIPPGRPHRLELDDDTTFAVEFYRSCDAGS